MSINYSQVSVFFSVELVEMPLIVRRNARISNKHAAIEDLLSIKTDTNVNGQYESKKMLIFNETLHLREMWTMVIDVCEELKNHHHIMIDKTTSKI